MLPLLIAACSSTTVSNDTPHQGDAGASAASAGAGTTTGGGGALGLGGSAGAASGGTGGSVSGAGTGGGATTAGTGGGEVAGGSGGAGGTCNGDECLACDEPTTDCGGACVDLQRDSDNCGACDRTCFGTACVEGACLPVSLFPSRAEPILDLTVAGSFVYFLDSGSAGSYVRRSTVDGSEPESAAWTFRTLSEFITDDSNHWSHWSEDWLRFGPAPLYSTPSGSSNFSFLSTAVLPETITAFRSNATHLVFSTSMMSLSIDRMSKQTGEVDNITTNSGFSAADTQLEVDDAYVYGVNEARDAVLRLTLEGGSAVSVVTAPGGEVISKLTLTPNEVVFVSSGGVRHAAKTGGAPAPLYDGPGVYSVIGDSTEPVAYYLTSVDGSESCALGSQLFAVNLAGGEPRRLATLDAGCIPEVAQDQRALYFITGDRTAIAKVSK